MCLHHRFHFFIFSLHPSVRYHHLPPISLPYQLRALPSSPTLPAHLPSLPLKLFSFSFLFGLHVLLLYVLFAHGAVIAPLLSAWTAAFLVHQLSLTTFSPCCSLRVAAPLHLFVPLWSLLLMLAVAVEGCRGCSSSWRPFSNSKRSSSITIFHTWILLPSMSFNQLVITPNFLFFFTYFFIFIYIFLIDFI